MSDQRLFEEAHVEEVGSDWRKVKVRFLRMDFVSGWIRVYVPAVGAGQEGTYSKLKKGDSVVCSFFDYPLNQKPFVFLKNISNDEQLAVDTEKVILFNGHKIIFETDKITIRFEDGTSQVILTAGKIAIKGAQDEFLDLMSQFLQSMATTTASGYPLMNSTELLALKVKLELMKGS